MPSTNFMKINKTIRPLLLPIAFIFASCQSPEETSADTGAEAAEVASEPTREAAVELLKSLATELEAGNEAAAVKFMGTYPGMSEEDMTGQMKGFLEKNEISSAGVEILAQKGKWGMLTEVFPDRGARLAEKWEVSPDECWALGYENAEAAFHWTGEKFEAIRCDDIGKLQ